MVFIVVPAYNEEKNIGNVIKTIPRQISKIDDVKVLVMDDCSTDKTIEVAKKFGVDKIIRHRKNKGGPCGMESG